MLKANKLSQVPGVAPFVKIGVLDGPDALISFYLILADEQIDQSSLVVVKLDIIPVFQVVGDGLFVVGVDQTIDEVEVGVKAVPR